MALYSTLGSMTLLLCVIVGFATLVTSPVWIPCAIVCFLLIFQTFPLIVMGGVLCKFTSLPLRISSTCSAVKDNMMKKACWSYVFAAAKR